MSKPILLFRGPVETRSGYGAHSRDLLYSLYQMDLFDIKVDSCSWGQTPRTALESTNAFHTWIKSSIINSIQQTPDFYVQVTVPNEFQRLGRFNIGITAGIETTIAPMSWVDGCNKMDMVITTSKFSKDVLLQTVYNENEKLTGKLIGQHRITKPIEVLFEGVDTSVFNNKGNSFDLDIKEDFAYLFVGHWLKGDLGQDRKDVGMLIRCFMESFNGEENKPALILKTSHATFSVKEREIFRNKIENICNGFKNPPSVYLLFGELTEDEMNSLYNHPKVKSMVSITKGEGFGRPLLEFSMTGKPIIASNWSGHKDFLPINKAIMVGGKLVEVHESVVDDFILKGSKWFTANYNEFVEVLKIVMKDYDNFKINSEDLRKINSENFSLSKMTDKFKEIITPFITEKPKEHKLVLPKLTKVK
jgi:glycosyltransferase involved in cell wall biosynthesis